MRRPILTWLAALAVLTVLAVPCGGRRSAAASAQAQSQDQRAQANPNFRVIGDEHADSPVEIHGMHGMQHGSQTDHLPGSSDNVTLLGQVDIDDVAPGDVADVTAYGNYAYLSVRDPEGCTDAGFAVIDIKDPRNPKQVGFIDATDGSFPGEGAHVIDLNTKFFKGQILLGNNELCNEETGEGGLSIWDVTNPLAPRC